eukprot:358075-Chlamydomonas_euryale.AAC.8
MARTGLVAAAAPSMVACGASTAPEQRAAADGLRMQRLFEAVAWGAQCRTRPLYSCHALLRERDAAWRRLCAPRGRCCCAHGPALSCMQ